MSAFTCSHRGKYLFGLCQRFKVPASVSVLRWCRQDIDECTAGSQQKFGSYVAPMPAMWGVHELEMQVSPPCGMRKLYDDFAWTWEQRYLALYEASSREIDPGLHPFVTDFSSDGWKGRYLIVCSFSFPSVAVCGFFDIIGIFHWAKCSKWWLPTSLHDFANCVRSRFPKSSGAIPRFELLCSDSGPRLQSTLIH